MNHKLIALTAAGTLAAGFLAVPAVAADPSSLGASYSAAAKVTPGAGVAPVVTTTGAIGGLLDFLTPVLDQVVTPLTAALTTLPSTLISDLVAGLTGSGYVANSPTSAQSPPASGFPTCGSNGWSTDDCYGPLVPTISAAPLLTLGTGTLQGYAAADSTGAYARSRTAGLTLSLLGVSVGNIGVSDSTSQCLATRVCSSTASLTGVSLLGGAVRVQSDSSGAVQVSLNNGSFVALSSLTSSTTVSAAGVTAHVQGQGSMLRVGIDLSLTQLLGALGVADVLGTLGATDAGTTASLTLTVGTGKATATDTTKAWGLELGVGLSANVAISVLGLISVGVSAPDTTTNGDLFDAQFAYTAAANADSTNTSGAPPELT